MKPEHSCALFSGAKLGSYGFGDGHPFGKDRARAFWEACTAAGLDQRVSMVMSEPAGRAALARFHTPAYLDYVAARCREGTGFLDDGDTPALPGIDEAAAWVAGAALTAATGIAAGQYARAFVPIAGLHHAARDHASGFCVYNDIGVAIEGLRAEHGITRIGYVDIDAHHGDGVFYAYEDDPDLIIADMHEDGRFLFPGTGFGEETGKGAARGSKLNIVLPPGADDDVFHTGWPQVEDLLRDSCPEFIILQCGADSVAGDPLSHLCFSAEVHGYAAARLRKLAEQLGHGRVLALGGGGYNRQNLALAWTNVLAALAS